MLRSMWVLISVLVVRALLYLYRPGGLLAYFFPSLCWFIIAIITVLICGFSELFSRSNKTLSMIALLAGIFQVVVLVDVGLFTKFGKSPVSFTPIIIALNSMMISTSLTGVEFSRAFLLNRYGRKKPLLSLVLISLFHSPTVAFIRMLLSSAKPLLIVDFLGSNFLSSLAENMLASYLALLAGPVASLAYIAPLRIFQWFSPILPDLPWSLKSLIGVVTPTISLMAIDYTLPIGFLRRAGLKVKVERTWKKEGFIGSIFMALAFVFAVWFSAGLFSVFPSVVMSGSMRPMMDVGDITILAKVPIEKIEVGDIIQYVTSEGMVMHRVVAIEDGYFITMGDANRRVDSNPVHPSQVRGKFMFLIPKVGWISIYIKYSISLFIQLLYSNFMALMSFLVSVSCLAVYFVYNRLGRRSRWGRWR